MAKQVVVRVAIAAIVLVATAPTALSWSEKGPG
jgi:hypothetical protein